MSRHSLQSVAGDGRLARGIRRTLGFVLAAHRSEASWDRYIAEIRAACQRLGYDAPEVEYPPLWHDHPAFIDEARNREHRCAAFMG